MTIFEKVAWAYLVIFGLLLLICIVRIAYVWPRPDIPRLKQNCNAFYIEQLEQFGTGDVVAVSFSSLTGNIVRFFTGSIWSHVGMIYVDPQTHQKYVMEMYRKSNGQQGL